MQNFIKWGNHVQLFESEEHAFSYFRGREDTCLSCFPKWVNVY